MLPYFHEWMAHKQQDETEMDSLEVLTWETEKKMKIKSWRLVHVNTCFSIHYLKTHFTEHKLSMLKPLDLILDTTHIHTQKPQTNKQQKKTPALKFMLSTLSNAHVYTSRSIILQVKFLINMYCPNILQNISSYKTNYT